MGNIPSAQRERTFAGTQDLAKRARLDGQDLVIGVEAAR